MSWIAPFGDDLRRYHPLVTERFHAHLQKTGLIPKGSTVLLGYSGGADSTCLLVLLKEVGVDVIAAHLHHGMRPEADEELARCEEFCTKIGVPFMSGRADVPAIAARLKIGVEEAGRKARYEFFDQCFFQTGSDFIATAHTQDDSVETLLLNLARGSGVSGLAGIPEKRGNIVRPLLTFSRRETRAFCEARALWFHDDPANDDESLARVKVRKRVVPLLQEINSAFLSNAARLSQILAEEDRFLDGMAAAALERAEVPLNGPLQFVSQDCEAAFERDALLSLPHVLLARALRLVTGVLGGAFDSHQTHSAIEGLATLERGSVTAEGGAVVVEWNQDRVHVRNLAVDSPYRHTLTLPGETTSEEFGWTLTAERTSPDLEKDPRNLDVTLGEEGVKGGLYFRSYEAGDSIAPLGLGGTKKVSDLFQEHGLTEAARRRIPIVCDLLGPVWVPGCCIAERVKVTKGTEKCIRLTFGPIRA